MKFRTILFFAGLLLLIVTLSENSVVAVDASSLPEIYGDGAVYYDEEGTATYFLSILKSYGINTIRVRLWVDPINIHSSLEEVTTFAEQIRSNGMDLWLCMHYSDSWADPSQQVTPGRWQDLSYEVFSDSIYQYTSDVVQQLQPEIVQLGNEINNGFLHPNGQLDINESQMLELLAEASLAVRDNSSESQIMFHYAGHSNALSFFEKLSGLDYDLIGLSYYPIWHGKSLSDLEENIKAIGNSTGKQVMIAETAYPFTLEWNDQTNNIVGLESQLILPNYPASVIGQYSFLFAISSMVRHEDYLDGFCYWGSEMIAWKGENSQSGSPWENQALFDFEFKALPVLNAFDQ